ncbi:MAG: hypothetical protein WDO18_18210 [Acidobacteriota bacterium]
MKHLFLLAILPAALLAQTLEGTWQGTVTPPNQNADIRLVFKIAKNGNAYQGNFYNLENGRQFNMSTVTLQGERGEDRDPWKRHDVTYEGKLEGDGLTGALTQDVPAIPLIMKRATTQTAWELPPPPAPRKRCRRGRSWSLRSRRSSPHPKVSRGRASTSTTASFARATRAFRTWLRSRSAST